MVNHGKPAMVTPCSPTYIKPFWNSVAQLRQDCPAGEALNLPFSAPPANVTKQSREKPCMVALG